MKKQANILHVLLIFFALTPAGASNLKQFLGGSGEACSTDAAGVVAGTYYSSGGEPNFCLTKTVSSGYSDSSNLNEYLLCAPNLYCYQGKCNSTVPGLYIAVTSTNWAIGGGRASADTLCEGTAFASKRYRCSQVRAIASFSATDEIVDMPTNYGFPTNIPIVMARSGGVDGSTVIATNWANFLSRNFVTAYSSLSSSFANYTIWSFSDQNGNFSAASSCSGGTDSTTSSNGTYWNPLSSSVNFQQATTTCNAVMRLMCLCEQE